MTENPSTNLTLFLMIWSGSPRTTRNNNSTMQYYCSTVTYTAPQRNHTPQNFPQQTKQSRIIRNCNPPRIWWNPGTQNFFRIGVLHPIVKPSFLQRYTPCRESVRQSIKLCITPCRESVRQSIKLCIVPLPRLRRAHLCVLLFAFVAQRGRTKGWARRRRGNAAVLVPINW